VTLTSSRTSPAHTGENGPAHHGKSGATLGNSRLVVVYALFAALSIAANLGSQKLAFWIYQGPRAVLLSVCAGTAVGLVVKYALDKAWIFRYAHDSVAHGVRTFSLYVVMGLGTTAIFWFFEFVADALFHTESVRLAGGAIGLVLGYLTKYRLDKRFVFTERRIR
jgi:putative flippase GtrA